MQRNHYFCLEESDMDKTALTLTIIGALNWALVGIFRFDLVAWIFGGQTAIWSRIIYTIVGLAGVWCISLLFRDWDRHAITENTTTRQPG